MEFNYFYFFHTAEEEEEEEEEEETWGTHGEFHTIQDVRDEDKKMSFHWNGVNGDSWIIDTTKSLKPKSELNKSFSS